MSRNPNIAVISIGYQTYAFTDTEAALQLMSILSKAVKVDASCYGMEKITPCTHFLDDSGDMPSLNFVPAGRFNPHETKAEVKARYEREQADRQDVDQQFSEAPRAPRALTAPAAEVVEEEVIF